MSSEVSQEVLVDETLKYVLKHSKDLEMNLDKINIFCTGCETSIGFLENNVTNIDTSNMDYPISLTDIFNKCNKKDKYCECKTESLVAEKKPKMLIWIYLKK